MAGSSVATSPLPDLLAVGCKCSHLVGWILVGPSLADTPSSFAFVEYEDRRDADDAYHDMHNKRLGRDDILKIEVRYARLHTLSSGVGI